MASTCSPTGLATGVLGVPDPGQQVADIVHQPGHGQLGVVRELVPQHRRRLGDVVQVGKRHLGRVGAICWPDLDRTVGTRRQ